MIECPCRDCAGDPVTCAIGDHAGDGPHCPDCGEVNYRWMGYLGARKRWAKVRGVSEKEMEDIWQARAEAELQSSSEGE